MSLTFQTSKKQQYMPDVLLQVIETSSRSKSHYCFSDTAIVLVILQKVHIWVHKNAMDQHHIDCAILEVENWKYHHSIANSKGSRMIYRSSNLKPSAKSITTSFSFRFPLFYLFRIRRRNSQVRGVRISYINEYGGPCAIWGGSGNRDGRQIDLCFSYSPLIAFRHCRSNFQKSIIE